MLTWLDVRPSRSFTTRGWTADFEGFSPVETRCFGQTGLQVSALGIGGAEIGFEKVDDRTVDALLGAASDVGVNVIDTAVMYLDSEEKIGRALRGRRQQFFLFTKCGLFPPSSHSILGLSARARHRIERFIRSSAEAPNALSWQPRVLAWNIEQSLRRLQVDCLDVIQLHSCPVETLRRGAVINVLHQARQAGKVRHIGYSGDGPAALYAVQSRQFDALQTSINIADQQAIDLTVPLAVQYHMGIVAKRPISNGLWKNHRRPDSVHDHVYWDRLKSLRYDFLNGDHAVETALRFTLSISGVHTAIVGTTNPAHFRQNAESAGAGALAREQFDAIRARWREAAQPSWTGQT